jgi:hypothetical protein
MEDVKEGAAPRGWVVALAAASALGVALRVRALFAGRSLWLDEAMLAWNICGRSLGGLLKPLDYNQGAPVGFLVLERLAVQWFGANELALRAVPFLASVVALALAGWFCLAHLGVRAAAVGVALVALAPSLISYAGELKQYSVDVTAALLALILAAGAVRHGLTARRAAGLAAAGAVLLWFSHPCAFVLAGSGTTLLAVGALRRRRDHVLFATGVCAVWLVSFAVSYALTLRDLNSNATLAEFWGPAFLPFPPTSASDLRQYVAVTVGVFESPFQNTQLDDSLAQRMAVITGAAWLVGCVALAGRGRRVLLALLVLPVAFALVAALLHKYPLRGRLALFTAGPTFLVVAAGLDTLLGARDLMNRTVGRVLLLGLLFLPSVQAAQFLLEKPRPYGPRTVLARVARDWRPGDVVLVDDNSEPQLRFYRAYGRDPELGRVVPTPCRSDLHDPVQLTAELRRRRGHARVWVLISTHLPDPGGREQRLLGFTLDQSGERLESVAAKGYCAFLCDLRG